MIGEVKKNKITYAPIPEKYEAGTMPTAEVITFKESIKFIKSIIILLILGSHSLFEATKKVSLFHLDI